MRRFPSRYASSYSFSPGPISTALKALIAANVLMFIVQRFAPEVDVTLGLVPIFVVKRYWVWQLCTYMFLHSGVFHIGFNMLTLWWFGADLERTWGTRYFLKFYFLTGIGAGVVTVLFSLLPFGFAEQLRYASVVGASGAIFGLLLAYALYFPERQIYMYFLFPLPARTFVLIIGAIEFYMTFAESGNGVASIAHLGGLAVAYAMLKGVRMHPMAEVKYRYLKWKINRVRKKFDVYSGGRADDWDRRVH